MDIPPPNEWLGFAKVAKELGITTKRVYHARVRGVKSITGDNVSLRSWKTLAGWVTTREALNEFLKKLNT